jgi:hypothetical protein
VNDIFGRVIDTPTAKFPFHTMIVIGGKPYLRGVATEAAGFELINEMFVSINASRNAKELPDLP